ncbi:MAG: MATE family efflux transporter, partial [Clostridia bacterium]|nr:MATE family efflux transporter [Clostridia bacterium]
DPVFIFAFKMGVTGAAVATVIGQIFAMIFTVITFAVKKSEVSISPKFVRMKGRTIVNIYKIGLPTIILNAIGSFTIMAMNGILRYFRSKYGITILGVYFKVQSFVFMPCFGLNQGILPILAYNYGANKKDRFYKAFRIALTVATVIMAVGFTLFQTVSRYILSVFGSISANEEMLEKAVSAFRIISVSFLPAGLSVITITMFQSIGKGVSSMFMSILRQVGVLLPAAFLLSLLAGVDLIWWSYPIAEIVVIVIFFPLALKTIKKVFYEKERAVNTEAVNAA